MAKSRYDQGYFTPVNPDKYLGDPKNIVYRSSWEKRLLVYLDNHPHVLQYASEEFFIPYISPVDGRQRRYFPDFLIKKRNKQGIVETLIIEVKPKNQTQKPRQRANQKKMLQETVQYAVNQAKWKAAEQFCADRKWKFMILTEAELGIK